MYKDALEKVVAEGGNIIVEGGVLSGEGYESGCYVKPAIAEAKTHFEIVQHETFAPILYLLKYSGDVENAIEIQNDVAQGLSSAIMTNNLREAEHFLICSRYRLWNCKRKYRNFRRRNWWCFWWRKRNRWWT